MIRPRKWFWSKKKLFYWRAVFAGMQFIRGRNCNQCNLFKPGGMKIQMKNSHGFINGYIERWDLLCWWQVWDIGDKSRLQHQDSRFNIQEPGILVYCDVGDWLECHQHLKFPTNITMSPTSLSFFLNPKIQASHFISDLLLRNAKISEKFHVFGITKKVRVIRTQLFSIDRD